MSNRIFLIWKADTSAGQYIPVGVLDHYRKKYLFQYTTGVQSALEAGFSLIPEFPDTKQLYSSSNLFPFFNNRLMDRSRKSFSQYMDAIALKPRDDRMHELARSGGRRVTDRYRLVSMPQQVRGKMKLVFFAVGLTRNPISKALAEVFPQLSKGDRLLLTPQVQNTEDPNAIMIHTERNEHVGWVPRYYAAELKDLLLRQPETFHCSVLRINFPYKRHAPDVLLVDLTSPWPKNWQPFEKGEFERMPITSAASDNSVDTQRSA